MSIGNDRGEVVSPVTVGTWRVVSEYAHALLQTCGVRQPPSGGVQIVQKPGLSVDSEFACLHPDSNIDPYGQPIVAIYVYSSGSQFESSMNRYMTSEVGLNPFPVGEVGSTNWTGSLIRGTFPGLNPSNLTNTKAGARGVSSGK